MQKLPNSISCQAVLDHVSDWTVKLWPSISMQSHFMNNSPYILFLRNCAPEGAFRGRMSRRPGAGPMMRLGRCCDAIRSEAEHGARGTPSGLGSHAPPCAFLRLLLEFRFLNLHPTLDPSILPVGPTLREQTTAMGRSALAPQPPAPSIKPRRRPFVTRTSQSTWDKGRSLRAENEQGKRRPKRGQGLEEAVRVRSSRYGGAVHAWLFPDVSGLALQPQGFLALSKTRDTDVIKSWWRRI